jgi:hypothetical protein
VLEIEVFEERPGKLYSQKQKSMSMVFRLCFFWHQQCIALMKLCFLTIWHIYNNKVTWTINVHDIYNLIYSAYINRTKQAEKQTIHFLLMNMVACIFFPRLSLMSSILQLYFFFINWQSLKKWWPPVFHFNTLSSLHEEWYYFSYISSYLQWFIYNILCY